MTGKSIEGDWEFISDKVGKKTVEQVCIICNNQEIFMQVTRDMIL